MARSVRALNLGHEYHHRYFWIEACPLFFPDQPLKRVSLERDTIKAFDDVIAWHARPRIDAHGREVDADHYQLKFHVDGRDVIRAADLVEPSFIGAAKVSLLERIRNAVAGGERRARLTLVTPWQIDPSDPLRHLVSNRAGEVNLARLFDTGKEMREVRELWVEHLGLEDAESLRPVLRHLQFWTGYPMWQVDRALQDRLMLAGLTPVDEGKRVHPYDGLARRFIDDDLHDFGPDDLRTILQKEGLWVGRPAPQADEPKQLGIKSFRRFAIHLEDEALTLDLLSHFIGRDLSSDVAWSNLAAQVAGFLDDQVRSGERYDLHLDCHYSLGFAAGVALQKADADVAPVQRGVGTREPWRPTGVVEGPQWDFEEISVGAGPDVAIGLSVTHQVRDDVLLFVNEALPAVGRVVIATVRGGPGQQAVRNADQAAALASGVTALAAQRTADERQGRLHIFPAAPNAMMFFLGRIGGRLGPTTIYEYAFEENRPGGYSPGVSLPR